jgi:hypothetical protein
VTGREPASFAVERFEVAGDACLEVHGRWFGVRGRRFMRPALTAVTDGRERRLLALLDHKPWTAEEGEAWLAAFPWSADPAELGETELTVAPDLTVPLPPPSSPAPRRRPRRVGSPHTAAGGTQAKAKGRPADARAAGDPGAPDGPLQAEHEAALRSRNEALAELDAVKRDRDRLRNDLAKALAACDKAVAERYDAIEAEVTLRIADLRAEAERERAAAGLAAQTARERDAARTARDEATRERDRAGAERDAARQERNRMLADRDKARTRAEEVTRQWELAAAWGTRRTQERDAVAIERDRLVRERDAAGEQQNRLARERDVALEQRDRVGRERDEALEQHQRTARERDEALEQRDLAIREPQPVESDTVAQAPSQPAAPSTPIPAGVHAPRRRPRRPPPPTVDPSRANTSRNQEDTLTARSVPTRQASAEWRTRLLAATALLVATVVLLVVLLAR